MGPRAAEGPSRAARGSQAGAAPAGGPFALEARDVYKVFVSRARRGRKAMTAVRAVNLSVRRGEFMTLIGPSGCGKSTVLNMFAGLTAPTDGTVLQDGQPIRGVNTRGGYITQDDNLLPWRTTLGNVEIALELKGVRRAERTARALDYLDRVGLRGFEHHYPHELSGGMRKRVSIVRTLVDESVNAIHDLVEAIALSDRIGIFTRAPGTIKEIHEVAISRPRDVFHIHEAPGFVPAYDAIWAGLRAEIAAGEVAPGG